MFRRLDNGKDYVSIVATTHNRLMKLARTLKVLFIFRSGHISSHVLTDSGL